jgi:hypothetical protein
MVDLASGAPLTNRDAMQCHHHNQAGRVLVQPHTLLTSEVSALPYNDTNTERLRYLAICTKAIDEVLRSDEVDTATKLECAIDFVKVAQVLAAGRCKDEPV